MADHQSDVQSRTPVVFMPALMRARGVLAAVGKVEGSRPLLFYRVILWEEG
jgi:hypothetical protein